jgi:transmembrane sensor
VQKKNYNLYSIEDFLSDESFIGYCLNENAEYVLQWEGVLINQPELKEIISSAKALFYLLSVKVNPLDKELELLKLKSAIESNETANILPAEVSSKKTPVTKWYTWLSAAAVLLICIGVFYKTAQKDYSKVIPALSQTIAKNLVKTGFNERKTVKLPDGSTVLLNSLTDLKIDNNYGVHNRVLWLTGEAFFKVAKNKDKPFIVISGKTSTTALGTSFKIKRYETDKDVSIMLATGKVNIGLVNKQDITNHAQLLPGDMFVVNESNKTFSKSSFPLTDLENWSNRRIVFFRASIKNIRSILKEVYGVEILNQNKPKKPIAFTGEFSGESLTEVLDAIGFSNHFTYSVTGNKVMLKF